MLSRGSILAGVPCQLRDRQASKQVVELVRSCSHSVPAIHQNFMEDGSEPPTHTFYFLSVSTQANNPLNQFHEFSIDSEAKINIAGKN